MNSIKIGVVFEYQHACIFDYEVYENLLYELTKILEGSEVEFVFLDADARYDRKILYGAVFLMKEGDASRDNALIQDAIRRLGLMEELSH